MLSEEDVPLQTKASTLNAKDISNVPYTSYGVSSKRNMSNISKTITIDISMKPGAQYSSEIEVCNIFIW